MTDDELTALAAKAYGNAPTGFSPLTDDGDALRLAVKLRFVVAVRGHEIEIFSDDDGDCLESISIPPDGSRCPLEMTRRAIVEAAAEIGKTRSD